MALPSEPSTDAWPMLEVFGAAPEEANGEYAPATYNDLACFVGVAQHNGKPNWQRVCGAKVYVLIFFKDSSSWQLCVWDNGCFEDQRLYQHISPLDGMLPPEDGWLQVLFNGVCAEPARQFSVRTSRPPLVINIGYASGAVDAGIECKSCLSGETIAVLPATLQTVEDVKTHLLEQFHQHCLVMMPSGAVLSEEQTKFGTLSDILSGDIPDKSSVHARRTLIESVSSGGKLIQDFSTDELTDRELVMAALEYDGLGLEHAPDEMRRDCSVVLTAVQQNVDAYLFAMGEAVDDRSIAFLAVSHSGGKLFEHVGSKLVGDKNLALVACLWNPDAAFPCLPNCSRQDRDVLQLALSYPARENVTDDKKFPNVEDFQSLCVDVDLQMAAVRRKPSLFQHAMEDIRADRKTVLSLLTPETVDQVWPFVSEELHGDPCVALQAIKLGSLKALIFATEELQSNRVFILDVLKKTSLHHGCFFEVLPRALAGDREVALRALGRKNCDYSLVLATVSERLRQDREFIAEVLRRDKGGQVFRDLPSSLRSDAMLVLAAARSSLRSLQCASGDLLADSDFVLSAMAAASEMDYTSADVMPYVSEKLASSVEFRERVKEAFPDDEDDSENGLDLFG